jgi:hypothetical protein
MLAGSGPYPRSVNDSREQYRRVIDGLVRECREGQGPIAAKRGDAQGAFESGVFIALRVLHDESIPPFDDGYEGTPFNDFVGRLNGWSWPSDSE